MSAAREHRCLAVSAGSPEFGSLGLGAVALRYQQLGYAVMGCRPGTKIPSEHYGPEGRGVLWADRDPRHCWWLWSRDRAAGIAIATGQRSRLMVIDLDVKGQHRGDHYFTQQFGGWPAPSWGYPLVSTPSGGWHLWLRLPEGYAVPNRPGILPGVDIKGDNGYVLAPPTRISVHAEGGPMMLPYRMADGCACSVPLAPPWILEWARFAPGGYGSSASGNGEPLEDVAQLQANGLTPGSRNETLHRTACRLYRLYGTTPAGDEAVARDLGAILHATARAGNLNGFGHGEVERAVESARRFVAEQQALDAAMVADYEGRA